MPQGTGVVVGIIDSGINSTHPSFAETDESGYTHNNPLGSGNYLGACDPSNTDQFVASFTCNDKLIGGYDFVNGLQGSGEDVPGPEDENGHGSHTAATAAGNTLNSASYLGVSNITISGVAPKANVIMYDSCYTATDGRGLCPGVSTLASVEQAIEDGIVDVINYSIGGGTSPWNDPVSMAFLSATQAGIFVSASAGNSGPGPGTLGHNEPWTASVGATTHGRYFSAILTVDADDYDYTPGTGPSASTTITADMRFAGDVDAANNEGCTAFTGTPFAGEIALIDRGSCAFATKVNNAELAGALAVIVVNNTTGRISMAGLEATNIPAGAVLQSDGTAIKTALAGGTLNSEMNPPEIKTDGQADMMADFSSRGPSPFEYNKPDVAAPGVNILAAYTNSGGTEPDYAVISGTSMAAPHNAGAAALLIERNRDWSVAEVKSALMMKAVTAGVMKEDGTTPADPLDMGAGRIQVDNAATATLVLDETATQFAAANPANGGDLKNLNVASLTDYNCQGTCTFTRTFRSVADEAITYEASLIDVPGTVTPSTFTVPKNGFQTVTVEVDASSLPYGVFSFGQLELKVNAFNTDTFTQNPNAVITDGGYPGDQACGQVEVSGVTYPLTAGAKVTIDYDMNYTWIGDLVMTAENPNGEVLGLLDRPGFPGSTYGSSADFVSGSTVRFDDTASTSAENSTGCSSGVCLLAPAPDTIITAPPNSIADLVATDVNGTWEICVGSAGVWEPGILNSVGVNVSAPIPATNLSYLPITVVAVEPSPIVNAVPGSLSYTMSTNSTSSRDVYIENESSATAVLDWSVQSAGNAVVKQFEQLNSGTGNGVLSDYLDQGNNFGYYSADNFILNNSAQLDTFYFDGFTNAADITTQIDAFTVEIYADNGGEPDGDPETTGSALFSLTLAVGDPNLVLTPGGEVTVDILGALGSSWSVPAGNYWVSGFANFIAADFDTWYWYSGTPAAGDVDNSLSIDPSDFFGEGTNWQPTTDPGLAFSVTSNYTCGASWLSTSPSSGVGVPIGGNDAVSVTVDTTGLAAGNYSAALCINSNDTSQPNMVVPVTLTVN
ncbi:S8 family serine peptidase [Marinicella sp. S6413]|nr:S8 family serine peptidase [Marinicella gelatinilytica]